MSGVASLIAAVSGARSAIITGLVVAGLALPIGRCAGSRSAEQACAAERALANAKIVRAEGAAYEQAAAERVADAVKSASHEKDLLDAIASVPDDEPDRVRVALGCSRLRAAGTREADLPAICRP